MPKVSVIGSGAWGTALANTLACNIEEVVVYTRNDETLREINNNRLNPECFKDVILRENIKAIKNIHEAVADTDFIFLVIPAQVVRAVCKQISESKSFSRNSTIVICSKGMEQGTLKLMSQVVDEILPFNKQAILSGPNFAVEVVQEIPTITTIACKDFELYKKISIILNTDYFTTHHCYDIVTAQVTGLLKNIVAIACGIVKGLGYGQNTIAAIMTLGYQESLRLSKFLNGEGTKVCAAYGLGDLVLTCGSTKSRNMSFGFSVGKGENPEDLLANSKTTVEGVKTLVSIMEFSKENSLSLPISSMVSKIINNNYSQEEIKNIIKETIKNLTKDL